MLDFLLKKMIINNITCDDIFLNEWVFLNVKSIKSMNKHIIKI